MKKLKKSLTFYFGLFFLSVMFYQCCGGEYLISGIRDLNISEDGTARADTLSTGFMISTYLEGEVVSNENKVNLFQSAWATSCEYKNANPLIEESISLALSEDIVHDGIAIEKGTSILDLEGVVITRYPQEIEIDVSNLFLDNASIPNGDYEITLSAETSDGLLLDSKVSTYFKFN